ncbi:MAG: rRNA pseudouridine synthase [Alphaproteobacteria bacterium]|nr:MAG: rRNA pseudouridine synthase [Alphaproteobacteria bacterium]
MKKEARIAKLIANAGICSRRDAEKLIHAGRVTHNDETVRTPAYNVSDESGIKVDGQSLTPQTKTYLWKYHKPRGVVSTHKDTHGRKTIHQDIPPDLGHIMNVGRLDLESEGLILFTNNGDLAKELMHPSSAIERIYDVTVQGEIPKHMCEHIHKGVCVKGMNYKPAVCNILASTSNTQRIVRFTLTEGKNREIRNILSFFKLRVLKLKRISYGGITLAPLKPRGFIRVGPQEGNTQFYKIFQKYQNNLAEY